MLDLIIAVLLVMVALGGAGALLLARSISRRRAERLAAQMEQTNLQRALLRVLAGNWDLLTHRQCELAERFYLQRFIDEGRESDKQLFERLYEQRKRLES